MKVRYLVLSLAALLVGCSKKQPEAIAQESCPLIMAAKSDDNLAKVKVLTDQGYSSQEASDVISSYNVVVSAGPDYVDTGQACVAAVMKDGEKLSQMEAEARKMQSGHEALTDLKSKMRDADQAVGRFLGTN